MSVIQAQTFAVSLKAELEEKTLRTVSLRLIPLLALCYGVAYMDRVNVSFAALQMNRDLHFSASVYGFGAGVFFLSYALCEIPANLLLLRFGARRWIARIMVTWGFLAAGMIFVATPREFYVMRFLLGMAEAGFFPGVIYYLTLWFSREVLARTISRFYIVVPLSGILMGSISGPLLGLQGRLGIAGWQWLFLVEGLPAICLGVLVFFVLPDGPAEASWLSAEERSGILTRLQEEQNAKASKSHRDLRGALGDTRIWQLGLFMLITIAAAYGCAFSAPLLIKDLTGFGNSTIGLIISATYLCAGAAMILNGMLASHKQAPHLYIVVPTFFAAFGCLVAGLSHLPVLVICSQGLIAICILANQPPMWIIPMSFLDDRGAAGGIALLNMFGIVGGFIGPYYMGLAKDITGSYSKGFLGLALPCLVAALVVLNLRRMEIRTRG
ncbi:MAG TPA: MFS transporter [Candidatus Acidoferrum sp.]|nr:MFS transporter [Candidatus Acidoferrum sp.]